MTQLLETAAIASPTQPTTPEAQDAARWWSELKWEVETHPERYNYQPGTKAAHLQAGLDPRDLSNLDVNPDCSRPTMVRSASGRWVSID